MSKIPYSYLAGFDGGEFIETCYARLLHRPSDPVGRYYHLSRLEAGDDKAIVIGRFLLSAEGRRAGARVSGLWPRFALKCLQKLPLLGPLFVPSINLERELRAIDNRLRRLIDASAATAGSVPTSPSPSASPGPSASPSPPSPPSAPPSTQPAANPAPAVTVARQDRPAVFLAVGVAASPALGRGLLAQGESVLFVRWNAETRNYQLAARGELEQLGVAADLGELAAIYPVGGVRSVLEPSSCGADDWLLCAETADADMIMEARRLGLRSAFIFHDAEPLRLPKSAGSGAEAHEQYMQALLLADAVIPVSTPAAADLKAFFAQHLLASSGPLIRHIPLPVEGSGSDVTLYARHVRAFLTEAAGQSQRLAALYYYGDPAAPPDRLARALTEYGISLIPVTWDRASGRLAPVQAGPEPVNMPRWLLFPDAPGAELLTKAMAFGKTQGLRTAVIMQEAGDGQDEGMFEALAGVDKVLAVSARRFREFQRFLLSWRGRVHSAEHRFKQLPAPVGEHADGHARRIAIELAADRLSDGLHPLEPQSGHDVYATLGNLRRRPRLSLCISTYNRAGWLALNLRNIFSQLAKPRGDVEILVVDNASSDHTPEVVKPYLARSDFRCIRNPQNVGMLGNLAVTAQRARGEHVWILGDDDLTRPWAIERVLKVIDQHPGIGLIYLNYGYSTEADPDKVTDLAGFLANCNTLEPAGGDEFAPVKKLAAKSENFFTAIYSHVLRRDHALKCYCQDTSGRIFSTMLSCVPSAYYVLNYMADEPAYWIGDQLLVVNSNVSWQDYGALLELEQLPRTWDLAERMGADPGEVDRRRAKRLWLVAMMWKQIFSDDKAGNSAYFSAARVLMRLKHLAEFDAHASEFRAVYEGARAAGHPAAFLPADELFSAFRTP
jgi:glycosyltransferase involved in cell wall biosynthesis